jgi:hypothetical protein
MIKRYEFKHITLESSYGLPKIKSVRFKGKYKTP